MNKTFNIGEEDYQKTLEFIDRKELKSGGFPLFPNTNIREYYKYIGDGVYEYYLITKFKEYDNVVAGKISYNTIGSLGIEIESILESEYTPNIFLDVLFKNMVYEYSHIIIPLHKSDFKWLSKIPIFFANNIDMRVIKFNGSKFVDVNEDIISLLLNKTEEELETYKIILKDKTTYEDI